jgi:hypothetical protein
MLPELCLDGIAEHILLRLAESSAELMELLDPLVV